MTIRLEEVMEAGDDGEAIDPPAISGPAGAMTLLQQLDARQDQLLDELEKLNGQIERVIGEWSTWRGDAAPAPAIPKAA
jgi:hypothetical protein